MKYFSKEELADNFEEYKKSLTKLNSWVYGRDEFWQEISKLSNDLEILDLGCGSGLFGKVLSEKFKQNKIKMVDIDDYRVHEKQKPFYQVDLSFEKLPFADNSFEVVTSFQLIEHLENPFNHLREVDRVLKPGGLFIISMPNGWNFYSRLKFLFRNKIEGYHKSDYRRRKLHNHISFIPKDIFMMLLKNFKVEKAIYRERKRPGFWIFAKIKIKHPKSEFFSDKLCYFLRKNK